MGPSSYESAKSFDFQARKGSKFTFGVSRNKSLRHFIDSEIQRSSVMPCPTAYARVLNPSGPSPAFRVRTQRYGSRTENYSDYFFKLQSRTPGPGSYAEPPRFQTPSMKFSRAADRFKPLCGQGPSASTYRPELPAGNMIGSKFSKSKISVLDREFQVARAIHTPGPGSYQRYSEFCPN